jgi:hypothetical protein
MTGANGEGVPHAGSCSCVVVERGARKLPSSVPFAGPPFISLDGGADASAGSLAWRAASVALSRRAVAPDGVFRSAISRRRVVIGQRRYLPSSLEIKVARTRLEPSESRAGAGTAHVS